MDLVSLIGFAAGTLTTLAFVPQVAGTLRTRRSDELSWGMLAAFAVGVALWTLYGILLRKPPIIVANAVTLALVLVLVGMKLRYDARPTR